jgi:lipoprotein-anchoring transpeptidase ErfK/SrfK
VRRSIIAPALSGVLLLLTRAGALGQIVEIPTFYHEIRLEITRSAHRVTVYRGDDQIQTYPVALGRPGWETPLGEFHILQMVRNPAWEHPLTHEVFPPGSRGNELGAYWIGFCADRDGVVGFHATPHPESVGKSLSHGCVRMHESDIREMFAEVNLGTLVTVVP